MLRDAIGFEVEKHFIKENIETGVICIPYLPSTEQKAPVLIKGLTKAQFDRMIDKLAI